MERFNSQIFLKIYEWMIVEDLVNLLDKDSFSEQFDKFNNKFQKFAKKLTQKEQEELVEATVVTKDLKFTNQAYHYMLPRLPGLYG